MKYQSKLGERGQVVIPKPIRDNLGLNKNSAIEFELKGATVTLRPSRDPQSSGSIGPERSPAGPSIASARAAGAPAIPSTRPSSRRPDTVRN